jgi:hypothetical protein
MPYVNIPDSGLHGTIAKIVGKMMGGVMSKVIQNSTNITNSLNRKGCPTGPETDRLRKKLNQNQKSLQQVQSRISKFKAIPGKLKPPLGGLKAALKIILTLPIPQGIGIPPGPAGGLIIGLPINITTKYADTMHLLKEFIKQIDEIIVAIEAVLDTPSASLKSLQRNLGSADTAVKCCEIEAALQKQLDNGDLTQTDIDDLGLSDDDGDLIFSSLGPKLLASVSNKGLTNSSKDSLKSKSDLNKKGKWLLKNPVSSNADGGDIIYLVNDQVKYNNVEYICIKEHTSSLENIPPTAEFWSTLDSAVSKGVSDLLSGIRKIEDSNINSNTKDLIRGLLDNFANIGEGKAGINSKFFHTGPDGVVYELRIKNDPQAPPIAPRRYAVAINPDGAEMFVGDKSFASDVEVLLNEIKFRIDNQLS